MYHLIEIEIVVGILSAEMFLVNVLRKISNKICLLNVLFWFVHFAAYLRSVA